LRIPDLSQQPVLGIKEIPRTGWFLQTVRIPSLIL